MENNSVKVRKAIYPGSFDPVTNGHVDIIRRAADLFDTVILAVLSNPSKQPMFSATERVRLLKEATADIPNLEYDIFSGLLVEYAEAKNVKAIIRGLRAVSDFDYEFQMALTNRQLSKELETVFLMTDYRYSYLSSSWVRQIASLHGKIKDMVPDVVSRELKKRFSGE